MKNEICWNITTRCNQACKYCHRFLKLDDLTYEENEKILENLIEDGIKNITWTGGEALLFPNLIELLKKAKKNGINNKMITNGILLLKKENEEILDYLDELTLSLDSINNEINKELGRGINHFSNIKEVLDIAKSKNIKININTVISKVNIEQSLELGKFLNKYNINIWRIFKFMPLRETAEKNRKIFEITSSEFNSNKNIFKNFTNINDIQYREEKDMENKYTLLVANGDIIKTENGIDVKKGNALYDSILEHVD